MQTLWRRLRLGADRGVSLVELLITMILMGVVGSLVTAAVVQISRIEIHNDDENRGLQDAKVVVERLSRDVREARGVTCSDPLSTLPHPCADHLQLWIDSNSDYVQQPTEVVTWRIVPSGGEHYDVVRQQGSGAGGTPTSSKTEATSLIVGIAFSYDTADPAKAQEVSMDMTYDALIGLGTKERHAVFTTRLRNKGSQ